ncbi:MAG: metallophosphoesterase family protein [Dehalococcoidia bacterium]|nr:MAG: metallophosphoesterase family protein [Dehalococcoidia bacterium]
MRYALVADIHANLPAFSAVLDDIERRGGVEELWCLGDIVGYGPSPSKCIALLCKHKHICIAGNHDLGAIGKVALSDFNPDAAYACRWTSQQLSLEERKYLESLPTMLQKDDFTLVHGSPKEPIWQYLISKGSAQENFSYFKTRFCLVGHSHVPLIFRQQDDDSCSVIPLSGSIGQVLGKSRMIVNPGSVGQPRDGDSRASYVIYDGDSGVVRLYRVEYDIDAIQKEMARKNLPVRLIIRLEHGL